MKRIKSYAMIGALLFITASCVENTEKYKKAIAQRDSLAIEKQVLDSNYQQTLVLLNEIETGFSVINQNERELKVNINGVEGNLKNKKDVIVAQMLEIKNNIEQNKIKLAVLRNMASKNGKAKTMLQEMIKRLETEMNEKKGQIQALQSELNLKKIQIDMLNTTVSDQSKNMADQKNLMEKQNTIIKSQETDLNTVWYCVATTKKLKEAKIISTSGIFQTKKVLAAEFDKKAFIQVDMRSINSIPTNSHKLKIISAHPKSSYKLVTGTNKNISIEISNPSKFWSVSKYLVVQI